MGDMTVKKLKYMMITSSPEMAGFAERMGVSRIFMDQEVLGKEARQGHLDTHKAAHTLDEIRAVARTLESAELMVRLNPLNKNTESEIESAIDAGGQRLMLPMFYSRSDVDRFLDAVAGRVPVTFLAETPQALVRLSDWLPLLRPGRDEVHIGLNDLSIGMGLKFLFEPLAAGLLDAPSEILRRSNVKWGFGGVGRVGRGDVDANLILSEHVRLGSDWVILSRAFTRGGGSSEPSCVTFEFKEEIEKIAAAERAWRCVSHEVLMSNQGKLARIVFDIVNGL